MDMRCRLLDPASNTHLWTQRVGAFTALPALIRRLGCEPAAVLEGSGLTETSLSHPENTVSYRAISRALELAAERTACPHFGLLAGRLFHLADLGVVGDLVRYASTVGRALDALVVHQHLNSQGGLAFLLRRGDFVDVGYAVYQPGVSGGRHVYDAALATLMNVMIELCGPSWTPYEVFLSHAKPLDLVQYRSFFNVVPRFGAEMSALRMRVSDLARPVQGADRAAYLLAEQRARDAGHPEFVQQVYRGLRRLMMDNQHSGDDLAQALVMHRRTLNRRLKAEGMTFQQVLDGVRYDIARDLLSNSDVHLDDIAATLGYAGVTPFMRTFRRWSGTTPGQWRQGKRVSSDDGAT